MLGIGFAAGLPAAQKALRIAVMVIVLGVLLLLSYCQGRSDGSNAVKLKDAEARQEQLKQEFAAGERAAETRLADERRQLEAEKTYEDVIAKAPGGRNSPASVALGCQRLRRAGYLDSELPADCRSGVGFGAEAATGAGDRN